LDEQEEKMVNGMVKNGIPSVIAKQIWELFPPFARYGFNKSHAACYALIAYRTAYLKAHYPEEFTASLMNGDAGDVERISFLITEARQEGLQILPPDINASYTRFVPEGPKKIRFGLLAVKNVGNAIAQALIDERSLRGPYKDFNDILVRVQHKDLNKKSLESLAKAGVFDSLGAERNQVIENLEEIVKFTSAIKKGGAQANSLFGPAQPTVTLTLKLKDAPPATSKQKLAWEKELLGFYLNDHPLRPFREKFQQIKARPLDELRKIRNEDMIVRTAGSGIAGQKNRDEKRPKHAFRSNRRFLAETHGSGGVRADARADGNRMAGWKHRRRRRQSVLARRGNEDDLRKSSSSGIVICPDSFRIVDPRFLKEKSGRTRAGAGGIRKSACPVGARRFMGPGRTCR
jgi:DNA polymerase-3 subunit alpha